MSDLSGQSKRWTLAELADHIGGCAKGDLTKTIAHVASLDTASSDAISHFSNATQASQLKSTNAGIVVLREQHLSDYVGNAIVTDNPRFAIAQIIDLVHPPSPLKLGIDGSALIGDDCDISKSVRIGKNVVIGDRCRIGDNTCIEAGAVVEHSVNIGDNCRIDSNVTIYRRSRVGDNTQISAGVVIGACGFSFEWVENRWVEIRNIGDVVIGDNVSIGACTTVDRGSLESTRIEHGVKIDNNCQIGHNVQIGENTLIVANVGIGGSAVIGKRCLIGGMSVVRDNTRIVDDVTICAVSCVTKSIDRPGSYSSAIPARKTSDWNRTLVKLQSESR